MKFCLISFLTCITFCGFTDIALAADTDVTNIGSAFERIVQSIEAVWDNTPLFLFGFMIFLIFAFVGHYVGGRERSWARITRNPFLAEISSQVFRLAFIILGLVTALDAIGARSLIGAVLGAAGITGIAIGFAVKDTIDNYVSSLMLSFNQPFRPNDFIEIGPHQGRVIRMTTRATILMTGDGNHLRIPNAMVYKSTILNYTRIPERRFTFNMGIAPDDDPQAAIQTGVTAIKSLPFVLSDPPALGFVENMGDSSIILTFRGWITQEDTSFTRARSLALRAVKLALEDNGFALPNPTYNISFDPTSGPLITDIVDGPEELKDLQYVLSEPPIELENFDPSQEAKIDKSIQERVLEERERGHEDDMLDETKPTE